MADNFLEYWQAKWAKARSLRQKKILAKQLAGAMESISKIAGVVLLDLAGREAEESRDDD